MLLSFVPVTHAYGKSNFQAGFAGTGVLKGSGQQFGFWGWCDFAGGTTSGNEADCKIDNYFQTSSGRIQFQESIQGTTWDEEPCTIQPCLPLGSSSPLDFFITAGTVTLSGPLILALEQSGPPPPPCTTTGTTVTCPIWVLEKIGFYNPDTGIPVVPGHYNLNSLLPAFGLVGEFQLQLTQIA